MKINFILRSMLALLVVVTLANCNNSTPAAPASGETVATPELGGESGDGKP